MLTFAVSTFYQFMPLPDCAALRAPIQDLCDSHGIKGILLLAPEGVNGTLAGGYEALAEVMAWLRRLLGCEDLKEKRSSTEQAPFLRMKVRLKAEIVTIGDTSVDPRKAMGVEVEPEAWNELIHDPEVVVVDVRNAFECAVGSFERAIDPETAAFSQFPAFVRTQLDPGQHKKIAMFCTGGIRCEKASSFMLGAGFEAVYQLKGGILNYLERIPQEDSLWRGACFVFDQRVAVGHGLVPADVVSCFGCRHPLSLQDRALPAYVPGVSCPHCAGSRTSDQTASAHERQRQVEIADRRGVPHLGREAQDQAGRRIDGPDRAARRINASASAAASTKAPAAPRGARGGGRSGSR